MFSPTDDVISRTEWFNNSFISIGTKSLNNDLKNALNFVSSIETFRSKTLPVWCTCWTFSIKDEDWMWRLRIKSADASLFGCLTNPMIQVNDWRHLSTTETSIVRSILVHIMICKISFDSSSLSINDFSNEIISFLFTLGLTVSYD